VLPILVVLPSRLQIVNSPGRASRDYLRYDKRLAL